MLFGKVSDRQDNPNCCILVDVLSIVTILSLCGFAFFLYLCIILFIEEILDAAPLSALKFRPKTLGAIHLSSEELWFINALSQYKFMDTMAPGCSVSEFL